MARIWIDLANPSHPHFFNALLPELKKKHQIQITGRERGETIKIAKDYGMELKVFGNHPENSIKKTLSVIHRSLTLGKYVSEFDFALAFENSMSIDYAIRKKKKSILFLDNDLKYKIKSNLIQDIESNIKMKADNIIIPIACKKVLSKYIDESKLKTYDGYKEDIYIADFEPKQDFLMQMPFTDYYVLRPEPMSSFYVKRKKTLIPEIIAEFKRYNYNIVLIPRDASDWKYRADGHVFIPNEPLNGLDLIYYSKGVLTGSGTMAREAAVMGKPAISFFPNDSLLSVDQDLIQKNRMIHSRNLAEIISYIQSDEGVKSKRDSKSVKRDVIQILMEILGD